MVESTNGARRLPRNITPSQEAWELAKDMAWKLKMSVSELFDKLVIDEQRRNRAMTE